VSEVVLTRRELNRATLARQLLLRRERLPVVEAVERLGGLQAQEPAAPYIALWSRLEGFEAAALRAAVEAGDLVKATLMRGTLHLVSAGDWTHLQPALAAGLARRARATPPDVLERVIEQVLEFVHEPRGQNELRAFVAEAGGNTEDGQWWQTRGQMPLLYLPTGGTWGFSLRPRLAGAPPALRERRASAEHGAELLVRRHLAAFGPATVDDLHAWSRLPTPLLRDAIERLGEEVEQLRDEDGRRLLDLRGAPRPGDVPAPPRFLSMWDSALLAFKDRSRLLDQEHYPVVVNRQGDHRPTFLVDGRVAGLWRANSGRVELLPFSPVPVRERRELEREARLLEAWLAPLDPKVFARYTGKLAPTGSA
jgi:uncharacterized protein YcaQ